MKQTVEEFLAKPFGKEEIRSNEFERKYQELQRKKRIHMEGHTKIGDDYFVHFKVGSDSSEKQFYDVVLQFTPSSERNKRDLSFRFYHVKFFSNSPSFMYQYAVLYKENGALIQMLYDKLDPEFATKAPKVSNPTNRLSYDKSIYSVCRFMQDSKITGFSKVGTLAKHRFKPSEFFENIKDFSTVKFDMEIHKMEKKMDKAIGDLDDEKKKDSKKGKAKVNAIHTKNLNLGTQIKASKAITARKPTKPRKARKN